MNKPESSKIVRKIKVYLPLAALALLSACAIHQEPLTLQSVGPEPRDAKPTSSEGWLTVYSLYAAWPPQGEINPVTHRSDYCINSEDGNTFREIKNHTDEYDEGPRRISLPPGNYRIQAKAIRSGTVIVPIVIKDGETTIVHLDGDGPKLEGKGKPANLVKLPNGYAVGWSAN